MRVVIGALWGLGGAVAGFVVAALLGSVLAKVANVSSREGAVGYFVISVGFLGAVAGTIGGIALFARSAPSGETLRSAGLAVLGLVGLAAVAALGVRAWAETREVPAEYGGARASLELEFRLKKADAPDGPPSRWLEAEVQTSTTRPVGLVLADRAREEGGLLVVPVVQDPLYRASGRVAVARVADRRVEVFQPPWKTKPDPRAGWSPWYRPVHVELPGADVPSAEGRRPILEMRYRVRPWGE